MSQIPLPHETTGNVNSKHLIVFVHGWPDNMELWSKVLPDLQKDSYLLNVSYPNYSDKEKSKWGEDFPIIAQRLKATIDEVNVTKRKVIFCVHDWGCIISYVFDTMYPGYVSEMIALDVSPWYNLSLFFVAYQMIIIVAFLLGGKLGNKIIQKLLSVFKKYNPTYKSKINATMGYFYYYFWKRLIKAKLNPANQSFFPGTSLGKYEPSCPVTYAYAVKKVLHFHTDKWLKKMQQEPNQLVAVENSTHWIPLDQPQLVVELLKKKILRVSAK